MGTTNGIELDATRRRLFVNETWQRRVWRCDVGPGGAVSNKRLIHEFDAGGLDGMRCDVDGRLYVTQPQLGTVVVLDPEGTICTSSRRNSSGYLDGRPMPGLLPLALSQNQVSAKAGQVHAKYCEQNDGYVVARLPRRSTVLRRAVGLGVSVVEEIILVRAFVASSRTRVFLSCSREIAKLAESCGC